MDNSLEKALFLIGYGLSANAQPYFLKLLPGDLASRVDEQIRGATTLDIDRLVPHERRLLAQLNIDLNGEEAENGEADGGGVEGGGVRQRAESLSR